MGSRIEIHSDAAGSTSTVQAAVLEKSDRSLRVALRSQGLVRLTDCCCFAGWSASWARRRRRLRAEAGRRALWGVVLVAVSFVCVGFSSGRCGAAGRPEPGRLQSPASNRAHSIPTKVYRYAERVVTKYDRDGSGALEKAEWSALRSDPSGADANSDDVLTVDEIASYVAAYARRHPIRSVLPRAAVVATPSTMRGDSGTSSRQKTTTSRSARAGRSSKRFYVPPTLLPPKLPAWFRARDRDGDGQLTLAEYAPTLNESAVREFTRYDRNHDGLLVPDEVLRGPRSLREMPEESSSEPAEKRNKGAVEQTEESSLGPETRASEQTPASSAEDEEPLGGAARAQSQRSQRRKDAPRSGNVSSDQRRRELDRERQRRLEQKRLRKERKKKSAAKRPRSHRSKEKQ